MDRMKTFFIYFLAFVGLFLVSNMLENGLIYDMYEKINGEIINTANIRNQKIELEIIDKDSRATNVNGYMNLSISNNMQNKIDKCYMKLELLNRQDLVAVTEYIELNDLEKNINKNYYLKFNANNIEKYRISLIDEKPDTSGIIRIFGFDINLSKYGIDPTNVFGIDLTNFGWDTIKEGGKTAWSFTVNFVKSLPTWAYVVASGIVLWNLPAGFLFFL